MKSKLLIINLILAIFTIAPLGANAKTPAKSRSTTTTAAAPKITYYEDGCPTPSGHTYSATTDSGKKMTATFNTNGRATLATGKESVTGNWEYMGGNVFTISSSAYDVVFFIMNNDGKTLVYVDQNGNPIAYFKLIK